MGGRLWTVCGIWIGISKGKRMSEVEREVKTRRTLITRSCVAVFWILGSRILGFVRSDFSIGNSVRLF